MSDTDRNPEPVRNCGTCRHRAVDGYCDFELPPIPQWLEDVWALVDKFVTKDTGTNCPTWQAKEDK